MEGLTKNDKMTKDIQVPEKEFEIRGSRGGKYFKNVNSNKFFLYIFRNEGKAKSKIKSKLIILIFLSLHKLPIEKLDPYTVQCMIYKAEMYILMKYPHLVEVNKKNEGISKTIDKNSKFFVIKSFSEEDVHKAIKYNVWTSTKFGNKILNDAFKEASQSGGSVYLFFSCNGSGRFLGIAKMKKEVEEDKFFPFWTQDNKWGGLFEIQWIFMKDLPFYLVKHLNFVMSDGKTRAISFSRDAQEVPYEQAREFIEIFQNFVNTNTILEHFEYYDIRQENYERMFPVKQMENLKFSG